MKKYYTISEVAGIFNTHAHQLRYIEKISPNFEVHKMKGRRYYTKENIDFLKSFIPGFAATEPHKAQEHSYTIKQIDILIEKFLKVRDRVRAAIGR